MLYGFVVARCVELQARGTTCPPQPVREEAASFTVHGTVLPLNENKVDSTHHSGYILVLLS